VHIVYLEPHGRRVDRDPLAFPDSYELGLEIELISPAEGVEARRARDYVQDKIERANQHIFISHLQEAGAEQRGIPWVVIKTTAKVDSGKGWLSLAALVPLILILMTITGAVYPAIDLTAGERERGTLEILVAAPIPRLGLLFAKYVTVLTVALLTALVNLVMMAVTLSVTGLGGVLFGSEGFSVVILLQVFGLLLLFAAFFSAVLLVLTSFARSFKEAQAYLIPLMLVSLAPGIIGLIPGLKLSGAMTVAPLLNIVLLGRDLFEHEAELGPAFVVSLSAFLYPVPALTLAARIFGAEGVLYNEQSSWGDLFRRPKEVQESGTVTAAMFCLAVMFPVYYVANALLGQATGLPIAGKLG